MAVRVAQRDSHEENQLPIDPTTGKCIPFTPAQIEAMQILTFDVRNQTHPTETREVNASTMKRTFLVVWEKRFEFFELVLGNVNVYVDSSINLQLSRLLPDPTFGVHPNRPQIIAMKIDSCTGFGKNLGEDANRMPYYNQAKVVVHYELVPWNLLDDANEQLTGSEFFRYTIPPTKGDSEADYITMPGGVLHYIVEGGTIVPIVGAIPIPHMRQIQFNIGKVFPTQKRSWTWVRIPANGYGPGSPLHTRLFQGSATDNPPYSVPWIGSINEDEIGNYPIGTLVLESVGEDLKRDVLGSDWVYDLTFNFNFRPTGWNWFPYFDPSTNTDGTPTNPTANGVYFVGKGNTVWGADLLPDNYALYNSRPMMMCFQL